jgi:hypothetical protein
MKSYLQISSIDSSPLDPFDFNNFNLLYSFITFSISLQGIKHKKKKKCLAHRSDPVQTYFDPRLRQCVAMSGSEFVYGQDKNIIQWELTP